MLPKVLRRSDMTFMHVLIDVRLYRLKSQTCVFIIKWVVSNAFANVGNYMHGTYVVHAWGRKISPALFVDAKM